MARTVAIVCLIAVAARTALSAPKTRASYNSIQDRIQQLAKDFEAHLQDALVPRHCADLLSNGQHTSGVYTVFHETAGTSGQDVYCDMDTDDGGWTVIQRRGQYGHNAYYFYRNWTEYANGFGDPADEYWIGNKALHALTSGDENMVLRIVLSNSTAEIASFDYEIFAVASEEEDFQLEVANFSGRNDLDTMGKLSGQKFSTFDRDNDVVSTNCAEQFRGAWWYRSCPVGNLNGLNLNGHHDSWGDGIVWELEYPTTDTMHYSFPKSKMMIRPAK
ncbi:hypothetical protein MTO96_017864 [Rhipicephalus appendiculatus]